MSNQKNFFRASYRQMHSTDTARYENSREAQAEPEVERVKEYIPRDVVHEDVAHGKQEPVGYAGSHEGRAKWKPSLHGDGEVDCFGGWIFRASDQFGHPVIRFVLDRPSEAEIMRAEEWYRRLGSMTNSRFLHRTSMEPVVMSGYAVFDFEIGYQLKSLGELHRKRELTYKKPEMLLEKLNDMILDYRAELARTRERYRPLNCLTMETVFVDEDNNVKVLPIFFSGKRYPIEIAREVLTANQTVDERSDLYSAAYVAVEAFSDSNGNQPICKPDSQIILDCLQTVREWRPAPEEVKKWLKGNRPQPITQVGGTPRNWEGHKKQPRSEQKESRKPSSIQKMGKLFKGVKPLEEPEQTFDLRGTLPPGTQASNNRRRPQNQDDSWYDSDC